MKKPLLFRICEKVTVFYFVSLQCPRRDIFPYRTISLRARAARCRGSENQRFSHFPLIPVRETSSCLAWCHFHSATLQCPQQDIFPYRNSIRFPFVRTIVLTNKGERLRFLSARQAVVSLGVTSIPLRYITVPPTGIEPVSAR